MPNAALGDPPYIALTTYRRDGRPVTTPVRLAALEGKIYVLRDAQAAVARAELPPNRLRDEGGR